MPCADDPDGFYAELTARNRGLIEPELQARLRRTRFVVAGCGSTGGAVLMPLLRTGAERMVLLDPGSYELNNLNRQDATLADLGRNKATVCAERLLAVNPCAVVEAHTAGVKADTILSVLDAGDIAMDAIDVTSDAGIDAKLAFHDAAARLRLTVVTAYDIATTQFIEVFDYKKVKRPLGGRVKPGAGPEQVLRSLIPPLALPREIFPVLAERRRDPSGGFPQLVMTSTLLGAMAVEIILRLLAGKPIRRRITVDLADLVRPALRRSAGRLRRDVGLVDLWRKMR
ncbi:MAG TPA: ThiF family adenylyltransferase [Candidatus Dormibacteraeota bacterium]